MAIGIMGGTFNPVHLGHLRAAEEVAESLQLTQIIFMPAAKPPHKSELGLVSFKHRFHMLEKAVADNPLFALSDLEHQRAGKSYSVETLSHLSNQHGTDLYFVLGLDAFLELPTWKSYLDLFSLCHFVVVPRPGFSPDSLYDLLKTQVSARYSLDSRVQGYVHPKKHTVYYREVTLLDISSSNIRKLLAQGCSVRYLLPEKVIEYIHQQGLYRQT